MFGKGIFIFKKLFTNWAINFVTNSVHNLIMLFQIIISISSIFLNCFVA